MPDEDLVDLIAREQIDVLIDLAGHTAGSRLPVFMRQSAPLQLTWLGYPATTGISAITGRLTDQYADPEGTESHYVESLIRLDGHFCAYRPMMSQPHMRYSADYKPKAPPAMKNGFITFGSCNTLAKYSETTIRMWARVLQSVPNSKLLIESPGLQTIALKRLVFQRFAAHGVSSDRVILWPRDTQRQYLIYNLIDIALDSFPCGGGTTTFDLLWMGVPLVTLPSDRFAGRMGVSALKAIGCSTWIANSEDNYVEIAQRLASDLSSLASQRAAQRDQFDNSPLTDEDGFAESFLDGIRTAWETIT
jgi:predicted O-linked N-acetylglucosamine transferase (SPINDLY family)